MINESNGLKKKIRNAAIKVGNFFMEPSIRKTTKFATSCLGILSYINLEKPLTIVTGSISMVDAAIEAFEVPYPTKTEYFAKKYNLKVKAGGLPLMIIEAGIRDKFIDRVVFTDNSWAVRELVIDKDSKLYYAENTDTTVYYQDNAGRIASNYYYTDNFNFSKLFKAIWDKYPTGVFISAPTSKRSMIDGNAMRLNNLTTEGLKYIGNIDPKEFAENLIQFRNENISRSFMLAGEPGSGKSSFVIDVAKHISNRIIRIDPTVAYSFSSTEFDFLIENLNPDIIVFDDFDRAAMMQDSQHLLFLLENIKYKFPKMIMFATVNYFEKLDKALVRPGRFDEIIWFDSPGIEVREKISTHYMKANKLEITPELLQKIIEKTEGLSPVYIKELCIRLKYKGVEAIDEVVEEFHRALDEIGLGFNEEQEISFESKLEDEAFSLENEEEYYDEEFYENLQKEIESEFEPLLIK